MAVYVHITETCQADAAAHGQTRFVESVRDKVLSTQTVGTFDQYLPSHFFKKSLGRSFRLIAHLSPMGDDELLVFVRTLPRGGSEYEAFLATIETRPHVVEEQFVPPAHRLAEIYAELTRTQAVQPPPGIDDEERAWLHEVFRTGSNDDDLVVLETDSWVKKIRSRGNLEFLVLFHDAVEQIDLTSAPATDEPQVIWLPRQRAGVVYAYRPELRRLVLFEPVRTQADADAAIALHGPRLRTAGTEGVDLRRLAGRAYPYLMILDPDLWLRIEKDEQSNLALSPEEAALLDSIRRQDSADAVGFPLFINGRAGSGKSTMLQYLAADYVEFGLRRSTVARPLYMTSSLDLLERARQTVKGLLTVHHARLLDHPLDERSIDEALGTSFVVFHEYLHSLLSDEDRPRFDPAKRVNYAEFRRRWSQDFSRRPEAKRITVDLAWHTIRSYIKGTRSTEDDELSLAEFVALPRKRRSGSPETYERIFGLVWEGWYKRICEDEGLWDDQDLAARVVATGTARNARHAAVFCDEAQDFTPLELEIIFQLSLYSQRSLFPEELRRVPIAFAGDPLQTINPSGFRWDAVQADFHEKYCGVLDPKRSQDVAITYRELRFNYRSNPGIVRFSNLIQLMRAAVLDRQDVLPQDAWWVDEPTQTVWFASDDGVTAGQLHQRPELIKLVNCEDGEETSYAERDPILKDLAAEGTGVFRNVLGPTRAKGLEFEAVVLYRFSESAPANFGEVLGGDVVLGDDPELELPFEYFFNRLYVAASRARAHLVVVDPAGAFRDFWRFATDADLVEKWMTTLRDPSPWRDAVTYLVQGRSESWTGERIDPLQQANEFADKGRQTRDAYLMRQASLAFLDARRPVDAARSVAEAMEFEGKLADAGRRYQDAGLREEAFRCYWDSAAFDGLRGLAVDPQFASRLESRAADYMAHPRDISSAFLDEIIRATGSDQWRRQAIRSSTWVSVLRALTDAIVAAKIPEGPGNASQLYAALAALTHDGLSLPASKLAALAYLVGEYSDAVALFEKGADTENDRYRRAKALTTRFPENVVWLSRLKDYAAVVAQWREHRGNDSGLDDATYRHVIDAALAEADVALAADLLGHRPDRERLHLLLKETGRHADASVAVIAARLAIAQFIRAHDWAAVVRVAESSDFGSKAGGAALRPLLEGNGEQQLMRMVLDALAGSDDLVADSSSGQSPVTDFLHRTIVRKGFAAKLDYGISVETSGAAIERAGRILDAIQYYEAIAGDKRASERERAFAAQRLVRSLERHAEYLRARGEEPQARRQEARARQVRETTGLRSRRVADFPSPRTGARSASPTSGRTPFEIVSSPLHQRLRIEHTARFETITVDATELTVRGDVPVERTDEKAASQVIWGVLAWNATVSLRRTRRGLLVEVRWDDQLESALLPRSSAS